MVSLILSLPYIMLYLKLADNKILKDYYKDYKHHDFLKRFRLIEPYQLPPPLGKQLVRDLDELHDCYCPRVYWPVCARNNVTYVNGCIMNCLKQNMSRPGPCIEYRRDGKTLFHLPVNDARPKFGFVTLLTASELKLANGLYSNTTNDTGIDVDPGSNYSSLYRVPSANLSYGNDMYEYFNLSDVAAPTNGELLSI